MISKMIRQTDTNMYELVSAISLLMTQLMLDGVGHVEHSESRSRDHVPGFSLIIDVTSKVDRRTTLHADRSEDFIG